MRGDVLARPGAAPRGPYAAETQLSCVQSQIATLLLGARGRHPGFCFLCGSPQLWTDN